MTEQQEYHYSKLNMREMRTGAPEDKWKKIYLALWPGPNETGIPSHFHGSAIIFSLPMIDKVLRETNLEGSPQLPIPKDGLEVQDGVHSESTIQQIPGQMQETDGKSGSTSGQMLPQALHSYLENLDLKMRLKKNPTGIEATTPTESAMERSLGDSTSLKMSKVDNSGSPPQHARYGQYISTNRDLEHSRPDNGPDTTQPRPENDWENGHHSTLDDYKQDTNNAFLQNPQPSDSGYGTGQHNPKCKYTLDKNSDSIDQLTGLFQGSQGNLGWQSEDPAGSFMGDTNTVYTAAMSLADPRLANHINYLVDDIYKRLRATRWDGSTIERLVTTLPSVLRTFALGLGYRASSQAHRDVMVFIHRFRRSIANTFNEYNNHEYDESFGKDKSVDCTAETLNRWLLSKDDQYDPIPDDNINDFIDEDEDQDSDFDIPGIDRYINIVCKDPMYKWLIAQLHRETLVSRPTPDTMESIRETVLRWLPSETRISRDASSSTVTAQYVAHWDILHFLQQQDYGIPHHDALAGVITLTGSSVDAQASTCLDYMSQTWPMTGPLTVQLLQRLLKNPGYVSRLEVSEPSPFTLEATIRDRALYVSVSGLADFVAEIGEQLSWLMGGYAGLSSRLLHPPEGLHDLMCEISFQILKQDASIQGVNGQCWHRMFNKPVVVKGFPIPRRPVAETGLEMSLPLMAALTRTRYINTFHSNPVLKGFSVMLVPTKTSNDTDIVYWHMVTSEHAEQRVAYPDSDFETAHVSKTDLIQARHILGWCEEALVTVGTSMAEYKVSRSQLPRPKAGCALEKIEVSGGQFVTGTAAFALGRREKPCIITRHGYFKKLQWISSKYVVFWDDWEKRGWLVNGASALLHLLQAAISQSRSMFQSEFLMKPGDLDEDTTATDCQRALRILTKKENRAIRLYMDRTEETSHQIGGNVARSSFDKYYCLQDEVEHIYNTLEVLVDYQAEAESRSGLKIDPRPQRCLEGWDFKDIVSDGDPFFPRVATLSYFGKGWVDLTRSIRATTILGRGFGELMQPKMAAGKPCPLWTTLPCGSYYLAAGVSDVKNIIERYDCDVGVNPVKICDGILWPVKSGGFRPCPCASANGKEKHHEPVQALLPVNFLTKLKQRAPVELADKGAVIFGQSRSISWIYPDDGDPVKGDVSLSEASGEPSCAMGSQSSTVPDSSSPSTQSSREYGSTPL
ncbi:pfs domain containing protein [Apiospora arundinis]|uniref:Pfs domain containing protein n=1 Tax=Apiospora arundinis TaxID=335852 RepID=A0ABR2IUW1_9PEZI